MYSASQPSHKKMDIDPLIQDQSDSVRQQIKQSLLQIFRDQYNYAAIDVEVDAIICLREVNSNHNDVIKIHQILSKQDLKHYKRPGNDFHTPRHSNQRSTGRASSFARMNGLQIKKRKMKENLHWKPRMGPKNSRLGTGNSYKSSLPIITGVFKSNIDTDCSMNDFTCDPQQNEGFSTEYNDMSTYSLPGGTKHDDIPVNQANPSGNKVIIDLSAAPTPSELKESEQGPMSQYEDEQAIQTNPEDLHPVAVFPNSGSLARFDLGENEGPFTNSESKQSNDISNSAFTNCRENISDDSQINKTENIQDNSSLPTPVCKDIKIEPIDYDQDRAASLFKESTGAESFSYTDNYTTFDVSSLDVNRDNLSLSDTKLGVKITHRSRKSKPEKFGSNSHFNSQPVFPSLPLSTSNTSGDTIASTDPLSSASQIMSGFTLSSDSNDIQSYASSMLDSASDAYLSVGNSSKFDPDSMFSCEKCGKMFTTKTTKIRHERFTCGKDMSECSVCGKFFSRLDSMQRHQLKLHGIQSPTSRNQQAVVWSQS